MLDASHVLKPPERLPVPLMCSKRFAAGIRSRPRIASTVTRWPVPVALGTGHCSLQGRSCPQPLENRFLVPLRPRPFTQFFKQVANLNVLIVDRLLGIDLYKLENHRQRFVLLDDPADETLITLMRVRNVRDVLSRFVVFRCARGSNSFPTGFWR